VTGPSIVGLGTAGLADGEAVGDSVAVTVLIGVCVGEGCEVAVALGGALAVALGAGVSVAADAAVGVDDGAGRVADAVAAAVDDGVAVALPCESSSPQPDISDRATTAVTSMRALRVAVTKRASMNPPARA
jgi:hypothetical protein